MKWGVLPKCKKPIEKSIKEFLCVETRSRNSILSLMWIPDGENWENRGQILSKRKEVSLSK